MRVNCTSWSRRVSANDSASKLSFQAGDYFEGEALAVLYRMTTLYGSTTRGKFWRMLAEYEAEARRQASPKAKRSATLPPRPSGG